MWKETMHNVNVMGVLVIKKIDGTLKIKTLEFGVTETMNSGVDVRRMLTGTRQQ